MLAPLDVIEFRVAVDAWEPGTVATVLETGVDSVLAEVADDEGRTLAVVTVPVDAAELLNDRSVPNRPEASPSVPPPDPQRLAAKALAPARSTASMSAELSRELC